MLGGPGEAVTAWSRAIPRAMARRCCLPAPGSSRRQTLTPKSCALRVFGTPSCDSSALALSIVMSEDPPPVATRPSFCSTCWPRCAAAARGNPARNVGDDLAQLAAAPPTALTPARLGAAAVNIRYLACRACARAAQSVPSPPWAGINGVAQEVTAHAARIRGSASAVSHLPRKFGAGYGPGARCQRVKS